MHSKMIDDESTVKVVCENEKLCFQDKVKEAKIEFTINADGELVQYRRYSNMYFEDFDVTLPYIVDYTFTVQN